MHIRAADGFELQATLYDANSDRAMLVASAMGVKRRYYDAFARHVADGGTSVVTFDYRGIGDSRPFDAARGRPRSLRGFEGSMLDWGRVDIPAAIAWIARELRPRSLTYVGHSCGGQLAGMAANAERVDRFVFVCAQSGYWRHWPGPSKWGLGALWLAMPPIARTLGWFPSKLLGLGAEDLPRGVAEQWGTWGRRPEYLFSDVDAAPYARLTAPILAYSFSDDRYAPKRAVEALLAKYAGAPLEHRHVERRGFGHFDFFRRGKGESYWDEVMRSAPDTLPSTAAALPHRAPATP